MNTKQHIDRLHQAMTFGGPVYSSPKLHSILRAVVKATIPGRQSAKNAAASMEAAVKAACRTIRRFK